MEGVGDGSKDLEFTSMEEEGRWLRGAFVACMKSHFSWDDHGEELSSECVGKLKVRYLGDNLLLIQGEKEDDTAKVLNGFDEWTDVWFEWWRSWQPTDVCQKRKVWTRWRGVPLQAWSSRFFELGCLLFSRMEAMHGVTEKRIRLDEAYIKVSTGFASVDRFLTCRIDRALFTIKVEEINCMDSEADGHQSGVCRSELESIFFESEVWSEDESVEALAGIHSATVNGDAPSVNGGRESSCSDTRDKSPTGKYTLGIGISVDNNDEGKAFKNIAGLENEVEDRANASTFSRDEGGSGLGLEGILEVEGPLVKEKAQAR